MMSDNPAYDNIEKPEPIYGSTTESIETVDDFKPDVSKKVRTVAYFGVAISSAIGAAVAGLAFVWLDPFNAGRVAASVVAIDSSIGIIGGMFGIIYRPTKRVK